MPFDHLKRRFINLIKVEFSVGEEAEDDFKVPFDNLNHRLSTSSKRHFGLVK